jgi:hypothetical protein
LKGKKMENGVASHRPARSGTANWGKKLLIDDPNSLQRGWLTSDEA